MVNFDFRRSNRKCSVSGRAFEPGEEFHSVLIEQGDELARKDFGRESWSGPPEECIGWWKSRVPNLELGRVYWAPKDVLLSYFEHLIQRSHDPDRIHVMAILLLQKKYLRLIDTIQRDGVETMQLVNSASKETFEVASMSIRPDRIASIQQEFAGKLFTDIAPDAADEEATTDSAPEV